jgi:hypothetical protein
VSHWAEIGADNKVLRVLVGDNNQVDEGKAFIESLGGTWVKTSYNNNIRFNYAGIGYIYDQGRDAFIAPKCHDEAVLDEATCCWTCNNAEHFSPIVSSDE